MPTLFLWCLGAALGLGIVRGLLAADNWLTYEQPEFYDQAFTIARRGPSMRVTLTEHPSRRIVAHDEPGLILDVPHVLVYDTTDRDVPAVIRAYKARNHDFFWCTTTGRQVEPDFFDLVVDC